MRTVIDIDDASLEAAKKVLGGVSLGRLYPDEATLENGLLVAVTEVVSEEDIVTFAAALQEVLA